MCMRCSMWITTVISLQPSEPGTLTGNPLCRLYVSNACDRAVAAAQEVRAGNIHLTRCGSATLWSKQGSNCLTIPVTICSLLRVSEAKDFCLECCQLQMESCPRSMGLRMLAWSRCTFGATWDGQSPPSSASWPEGQHQQWCLFALSPAS